MPHYEFFCHNCKKLFAEILSLVDCEESSMPALRQQERRAALAPLFRHHVEKER